MLNCSRRNVLSDSCLFTIFANILLCIRINQENYVREYIMPGCIMCMPTCLFIYKMIPVNTSCWANAGLMLAHRLRRWPNINPSLAQRVLFAGMERGRGGGGAECADVACHDCMMRSRWQNQPADEDNFELMKLIILIWADEAGLGRLGWSNRPQLMGSTRVIGVEMSCWSLWSHVV